MTDSSQTASGGSTTQADIKAKVSELAGKASSGFTIFKRRTAGTSFFGVKFTGTEWGLQAVGKASATKGKIVASR